jgi:TUP1-like enhancer of split
LTGAHRMLHQAVDRTDAEPAGAQVYTAGGRQLLPPVQLGGRPAFLAAADPWRLLAVAAGGTFWVWDLAALRVEVQGSAAPLLALAPARGAGLLTRQLLDMR